MTRHTLRDLMIGLQGALLVLWLVATIADNGWAVVVLSLTLATIYAFTPSRLPPRNERGQFSKRD